MSERPFADAAAPLGLTEDDLILRIGSLLHARAITRFGPMFNADRMGGAFCLCAIAVPVERFEEVAAIVNAHIEVAHNYERTHALNMWFVLATATVAGIDEVADRIAAETGLDVHLFPKLDEYFIGLRVDL